jgi:hypothetical protein
MLFNTALLTKCSIEGSLLQRKKEIILLFKKEVENIIKIELYISYTSIISQDTCSLSNSIKHHK